MKQICVSGVKQPRYLLVPLLSATIMFSPRAPHNKRLDVDGSIIDLESALEMKTRDSLPEEWADIVHKLGTAYSRRFFGLRREDNIEKSIQCFRMALEVRTRDSNPEEWA